MADARGHKYICAAARDITPNGHDWCRGDCASNPNRDGAAYKYTVGTGNSNAATYQ